tara:strand:+ start:9508 stop:10833 length:1326 start_codon:yes stop_codon:yes gene_type:complete
MKTLKLFLILLFTLNLTYSQNKVTETINKKIILKFDQKSKNLTLKKCDNNHSHKTFICNYEIKKGESYVLIIEGINTAVVKETIEFKPFMISSDTPEIIKPFFLGISNSSEIDYGIGIASVATTSTNADLDPLYDNAVLYYNLLVSLKNNSNELYSSSVFETNKKKADSLIQPTLDLFDADDLDDLNSKINISETYIKSINELFKIRLDKASNVSTAIIEKFARLTKISKDLSDKDFTKYSNFIFASTKAENQTKPEVFIAKNDGLDIDITLINTYSKDTITKKTIDFYSKGNFSFDFSSGFFYTNEIEKSYYLEKRDSLTTNIIEEKNRDFDISFGALGHFSYKFSSTFKAGISMGASLSPLDGKTRYLIGSSFIFGRNRQLSFNSGLSLVKLKVLSGSINENEIGKYVDASVTSIPTFEKVQSGLFFGFSYNLTSKKKY